MKKFLIQLAALFVLVQIFNTVFASILTDLRATAWGMALTVTFFLALGWYWDNIWDFFARKFKGNV